MYVASEVQERSNAPLPGQKLVTKVSKSRAIPPYVPGSTPGMAADKCIIRKIKIKVNRRFDVSNIKVEVVYANVKVVMRELSRYFILGA